MIQNLIYGVWSSAFSYRFSSRKSQRQQKLAKKITRFTIPFRSKSHSFYEPQLTQHYKKCTPATQPKTLLTLQFTQIYSISQQTCFWFVSENFLHCIISRHPRTSFWKQLESKYLHIPVYLRNNFLSV